MKKALFLDRDGVITPMIYMQDPDVISTIWSSKQIELQFGIVDLCKAAVEKGYLLIVVSNQPGIGLKQFTKDEFEKIRVRMKELFATEGIELTDEYYAFYHPYAKIEEYSKMEDLRKPKPDMLLQAAKKHDIDLSSSWFVGDGVNDVKAGAAAGCRTCLIANVYESEYLRLLEKNLDGVKPDVMIKKLPELIEYL